MPRNKNEPADNKLRFYVAQDDLFIDLNLYQFGWERCEPLHQFGPARRNHFLFHYIISGTGRLDAADQTFFLKPGQGFLLCPEMISSYFADEKDPWHYVWVEFDGLRARESMTLAGMNEKQPIYSPVRPGLTSVKDLMLQIVEDADKAPIRLVGYGMVLMDEIIRTSKTQISYTKKKLRDFYMREALNYIHGNYQRDLTVEEIADSSGLNRSYFSRLFKSRFGLSPQAYLLQYRMNKAAELLKHSQLSISDIASSVGYENQFHFSRAFRNTFGISPTGYRSEHLIQK